MQRVWLALVVTFAWGVTAVAQQAVDDETPGAHKKVVPPPPEPAAQPAPKAEPETPPAEEKKGKKKKGKKKKGAEEAPPAPAPTPPPEPTPAPALPARPAPAPQAVEPEPAPRLKPVAASVERAPGEPTYSAGFRLRYITVPGWFLGAFTQVNQPLNSASIAGEFVRRKENLDVVASMDFSWMSPADGNWLGNNHPAATDTDYVQFRGLNLFSIDVSFIWHHPFNDWFQLEYGAGVGIGFVLGDILRTSDGSPGCATAPADPVVCHPVLPECTSGPCSESALAASMAPAGVHNDSAASPHRFVDDNKPPVVPIVNLLLGAVFHVHPKARVRVEGGFRDAFFLGVGSEYAF